MGMESFVQLRRGITPHHVHRDLDGLKDDELGRLGFVGRQAQLYRRNDPTRYRAVGQLAPADVTVADLHPTDEQDEAGEPLVLFANAEVRILLSRRSRPMPFFARNVGGDELYFVHEGRGCFETEFGTIPYEPGDWVLLPKAVTYRQVPDEGAGTFLVVESVDQLEVPDPGLLGRHHPFDPTTVYVPEPEVRTDGGPEWSVRLVRGEERGWLHYPFNPCDVAGWKGDYFPFKLNIADYNPILSDGVHLPPTVSCFLRADGVSVLNFLPRRAESRPGVERLPWYHRNADYDEVSLFHGGSVFGSALPAGLITYAPQGVHHGPPERARDRARRLFDEFDTLDWSIMSIDVRRPLAVSPAVRDAAVRDAAVRDAAERDASGGDR